MNNVNRRLLLIALAVSAVLWSAASSASIYLKYGEIKGEATAEGYEVWRDIETYVLPTDAIAEVRLRRADKPTE